MLKTIEAINGSINNFVWGPVMLALFLFTGLYFTVRTGFFQVSHLKDWFSNTILAAFKKKDVRKTDDKKAISQFQSLCTALAATVGTGNIVGVATAIATGGPGAVFWMWCSAFLGMMTNYAENTLGIKYRYKNEKNEWVGGAMIYMDRGLGWKPLAMIFSVFCVLASFGIGNMSQANSISSSLESAFGFNKYIVGIAIAILAGLVIVGGIKRIATVTEKFVPFMAVTYIVGGLVVLVINYQAIPNAFAAIVREAFNFKAATGGVLGYGIMLAMRKGISRGVFSNEAGLGSSVMVHSASDVKEPVIQGMWGIFEVFADTLVICTITALVILTSGVYEIDKYQDYYLVVEDKLNAITAEVTEKTENELANGADYEKIYGFAEAGIERVINECDLHPEVPVVTLYDAKGCFEAVINAALEPLNESEKFDAVKTGADFSALLEKSMGRVGDDEPVEKGAPLTAASFKNTLDKVHPGLGTAGKLFVSIALVFFAFSTILGWSYYGQRGIEYLFGTGATPVYKTIFLIMIVVGCTANLELVWDISDTFNGLMALPNLIAVLFLSPEVVKMTKNYLGK